MKVLDLFSGIGGFSVGLEKAGFKTVAFCEIEPYCQAVLRKHWPDTPIYNDVRSLTGEQLRADGLVPDVIVGGYPCQPFSVAGKQRGAEDDRHLWPEVYRLVADIRPSWCIFENVAGHIKLGLDEVLSDLEAEGYAARPFVIPACGVDAPHRRDRVWIVANTKVGDAGGTPEQNRRANEEIQERNDGGELGEPSQVCTANVGDTQRSGQPGDDGRRSGQEPTDGRKAVAYADNTRNRTSRRSDDAKRAATEQGRQEQSLSKSGGQREAVADTSGQRLQGRTEEPVYGVGGISEQSERSDKDRRELWPTEPNVGRVANGVPARSHRIRALGNAVVPQIPEVIGRLILQIEGDE
jgi:DNA (cytosine-5)-methyltransferase 1